MFIALFQLVQLSNVGDSFQDFNSKILYPSLEIKNNEKNVVFCSPQINSSAPLEQWLAI